MAGKELRLIVLRLMVATGALAVALTAFAEESMLTFRFMNTPLDVVLSDYAEKAGKRVEVVKGTHATLTLKTDRAVSVSTYCRIVEDALASMNIGLFPIGTNRLVAAWIDPAKGWSRMAVTNEPWQRELQARRKAVLRGDPIRAPLSEETVRKLRDYQMDLIRSGKAPLPIPLTEEMDAQLVKEGVLPPARGHEE